MGKRSFNHWTESKRMDIPLHESSLVMQQAVLRQFSLNAGNLHSWNCRRLILFPTKLMYSWGTIVIMSAEVESKYCYYSQGNQKPWTPEENIASHGSFLDATFLKFYSQNSKFYSRCVSHACQFLHFFSFSQRFHVTLSVCSSESLS